MTQTFSKHLTEWLSCYSKDGVRATATAATRVHVHVWFCSTCSGLLTTPPPLSHSFSFACFPDTVSSASPRPQHAPLLSSPLPTPHFIPLLALLPAAASKPLTASGEMADWIYTSCPSIIREVGGVGVEGRGVWREDRGTEREKKSGIKKGEGKDNLRDRHRHKSPERGSKRLHRIWRQSNVGSGEGKRLCEMFRSQTCRYFQQTRVRSASLQVALR